MLSHLSVKPRKGIRLTKGPRKNLTRVGFHLTTHGFRSPLLCQLSCKARTGVCRGCQRSYFTAQKQVTKNYVLNVGSVALILYQSDPVAHRQPTTRLALVLKVRRSRVRIPPWSKFFLLLCGGPISLPRANDRMGSHRNFSALLFTLQNYLDQMQGSTS